MPSGLEGRHPKQELEEEHAQAPHVHCRVVLAALHCSAHTGSSTASHHERRQVQAVASVKGSWVP